MLKQFLVISVLKKNPTTGRTTKSTPVIDTMRIDTCTFHQILETAAEVGLRSRLQQMVPVKCKDLLKSIAIQLLYDFNSTQDVRHLISHLGVAPLYFDPRNNEHDKSRCCCCAERTRLALNPWHHLRCRNTLHCKENAKRPDITRSQKSMGCAMTRLCRWTWLITVLRPTGIS